MENTKKRNNVMIRIAAFVLMCTLVTSCFAGSTFARYTSRAEGNAKATVAMWSFKVDDEEIATGSTEELKIELFETIFDTVDGNAETDVVEKKIAPGTKGAFDLKVQNTSEVTADYVIKIKPTCSNDALKSAIVFKVDGTAVDWSNVDENGYLTISPSDNVLAIGSDAKTVNVTWEWDIGEDDTYTAIGIAARENTLEYSLDVIVVASQVD